MVVETWSVQLPVKARISTNPLRRNHELIERLLVVPFLQKQNWMNSNTGANSNDRLRIMPAPILSPSLPGAHHTIAIAPEAHIPNICATLIYMHPCKSLQETKSALIASKVTHEEQWMGPGIRWETGRTWQALACPTAMSRLGRKEGNMNDEQKTEIKVSRREQKEALPHNLTWKMNCRMFKHTLQQTNTMDNPANNLRQPILCSTTSIIDPSTGRTVGRRDT